MTRSMTRTMTRIPTLAILILLATLVASPVVAQAPAPVPVPIVQPQPSPPEVTLRDLDHLKETLRDGLATQDKLDQERTASLRETIAEQDKRIADLQTFIGWVIGLFGIGVALASLFTYGKAKAEAQDQAVKWMDVHAAKVLDDLEREYRQEIDTRLDKTEAKANVAYQSFLQKVGTLSDKLQGAMGKDEGAHLSNEEQNDFDQAVKAIHEIPRSQWGAEEWDMFATSEYYAGRFDSVLDALEQIDRCADASAEAKAKALVGKGLVLQRAGRPDEALAAYDAVEQRFGTVSAVVVRMLVATARGNRGFTRIVMAKKALSEGSADGQAKAKAVLQDALKDVFASLEVLPEDPICIGNKGYALFLLGDDLDAAEQAFVEAFKRGNEDFYQATLKDAEIHPLPQDEDFVAMVKRLWAAEQVRRQAKGENGDGEAKDA